MNIRVVNIKVLHTVFYALFFALITYGIEFLLPRYYPALDDGMILNSSYPTVFFIIRIFVQLLQVAVLMYLSTMALGKITEFGTRKKMFVPLGVFLIMASVLDFSVYYLIPLIIALCIITVIMTALYYYGIRYDFFTCMNGYILFVVCNAVLNSPHVYATAIPLVLFVLAVVLYNYKKHNLLVL